MLAHRDTHRRFGGKGDDQLDDSASGGSRLYDDRGNSKVVPGPGTSEDERPFDQQLDSAGNPTRDWGHQRTHSPMARAGGDLGLLFGGAVNFTTYSFRHNPYSRRQSLSAGFSTGLRAFRGEYNGEFVRENRNARFRLHARASGVDLIRFYGFGNETSGNAPEGFFEVLQRQFSVSPQYQFAFHRIDISIGALARYTNEPLRTSLAAVTRPYGFGGFGKVGPSVDFELGRRERAIDGSRGGTLRAGGSFFPSLWSVTRPFGEVHAEGGGFLGARSVPLRPTLAIRAGGKRVFGRYPFQDAALLGGADSLRGLRPQRYAGDAVAYGSAELRLRLGQVKLLLPSDVGVFGLADVGRVFSARENSRRWHTGVGAGLWFAFLKPENTVSVAFARSEGATRFYLRTGFGF